MSRIHRITISNFQRIEGVTVEPKGSVTKVKGRNAAGKSSFIAAIEAVLGGEKHRPDRPLRVGAKKGEVSIEFGEYVATLKLAESGNNYLSVTGKDGEPVKGGAQAFLNKLIGPGGLAFDPLAFAETLNPKEQAAALMRAVGLDLAPVEAKRKEIYDERTLVGRQAEHAKMRLTPHPPGAFDGVPDEEQTAGDVAERLANMRAAREAETAHVARVAASDREIAATKARIEQLQTELKRLETDRARMIEGKPPAAPSPEEIGALQEQLRNIDALNTRVREKKARKTAEADHKALADQYDALTRKLETIEQRKVSLIAETPLPIDGLAFTEDGITLAGVPFAQASTAQKLRVGVAVALADRPDLRCILIRQGSLLDSGGMAALRELVEAHQAQAFVEVVSDDAELTIVDAA